MRHLKVALAAACVAVVGWAFTASADISVSAYRQRNHLIAQWDGIDNAGTGTHDAGATTWKDLSGNGNDLTLASGKGSFVDGKALFCNNAIGCAAAKKAIGNYRTIEIVYKMEPGNDKQCIVNSGVQDRFAWHIVSGAKFQVQFSQKHPTATVPNSYGFNRIAATYASDSPTAAPTPNAAWTDGEHSEGAYDETWSSRPSVFTVGWGTGASRTFKGRVYAVRLYDCELSDADIAWNAMIDLVRFNGNGDDCRYDETTGNLEVRAKVRAPSGGKVSLDGADPSAEASVWVPFGSTKQVTLEAVPDEGATFVEWIGDIGAADAKAASVTATLKASTVPVLARFRREGDGMPYIRRGLMTLFDGVDNAGVGQHVEDLRVWKDLAGDFDLTLTGLGAFVDGKALSVSGGAAAYGPRATAAYRTIDVAYKMTVVTGRILFESGCTVGTTANYSRRWVLFDSNGAKLYADGSNSSTKYIANTVQTNVRRNFAATYDESSLVTDLFADGAGAAAPGTMSNSWGLGDGVAMIGDRVRTTPTTYTWSGLVYGLRLYSVELTPGEIAYNAALDRVRFDGEDPDDVTWPDGYKYDAETGRTLVRVSLTGTDGAQVSADGESWSDSVVVWCEQQTPKTFYARPAAGSAIGAWQGLPDGATVSDDKTSATFVLPGPISVSAVSHAPMTLRWRGGASELASDVANWAKDGGGVAALPPVSGDAVHFDKDSPSMTWDLDGVTLASWTQDEDFTGTNTFLTGPVHEGVDSPTRGVLSADGRRRELVVTGDITLNGGRWHQANTPSLAKTHPGWTTGEGVYRLIARAGGNFTVGAKAVVEANLSGFRKEEGPGKTGSRGATHGGSDNGYYAGNLASPETNHYGSVRHPVTQGSGAVYSVGGGALELSADGTFALDGALEADGGSYKYYTGSGGSVFVTAATLTGTGHVYACGYCTEASAGAGGRLAFVVTGPGATFDGFTATLRCYGNSGHCNPGTIYWETPNDRANGGVLEIRGRNSLSVDNRGYYTMLVDTGEDFTFDTVVLTNKVKFAIGPGVTLKANRIISNTTNNRLVLLGGKLVVPDGYALTNVILRNDYYPSSVGTPAGATGTNLLAKGATFTIDRRIDFDGTFRMLSGAKVNHTAAGNSDADLFRADFTAREFVLDSGATVDLTALGYPAAAGPGKPVDDGKTSRGGSHGGLAHDVGSVQAYGSITRPVTLGSGGLNGIGGGATHIVVSGRSVIDGTISANGQANSRSGAGGSVWLETGTLEGASTGVIRANGGKGSDGYEFYAGAGGRVAVTLTEPGADFSQYQGTIRAAGAVANVTVNKVKTYYAAGDGTVYLRKGGETETEGTLIVDGDATCVNDDNFTDITRDVTENTVGHVVITNGGNLRVRKGAELNVRRSFANVSRYREGLANGELGDDSLAPGAVKFVDASVESLVTGTNVFMCLKCAEPGKIVRFGAAEATRTGIAAGGSLAVSGIAGTSVFLRGLADAEPWLFDFHGKADVSYADVMDSDASMGDKVSVDDTNHDSGNNLNWGFVGIKIGDTNVWNGANGTAWATADNWSLGRAPADSDVIVIPAGAVCSPEIAEAVALNRLEIAAGKSLTLNGFSLSVTNGVDCQGAFVCSDAETLTLDGDVTIKSFTAANSTLVLSGTRSRTANLSGQQFNDVVIAGTEPTLSLADGFSANRLTLASGVARTIEFPSDRTVAVGEFAFSGAVGGEAALTLKGTITGGRWNLNVTGKGAGSGVIVSDSCAVGQRIFAYDPSVEGVSVSGWVFGVSETTWIGGASGNWSDSSKWSGNAVPGADSCVHFTSDAMVTLDVDDATAQILDVSGCTVKLKGAKTLTVTSLLEILDGGTLEQAAADNVIHVQGAAFVRSGGAWTHASNGASDQGFGISASVDGDFTIDAGGKVDAYMKGFNAYKGWATQQQASHGARYSSTSKPCYGSMFRPTDIGSGGGWDGGHAGGRVYLTVKGTLTANGEIDASSMIEAWYPGSGGSILLECGRLAGSGLIRAQGGSRSNADSAAGCGGRVAVYLTEATDLASFEGAGGLIQAYGGINNHTAGSLPIASCGTFYLQAKGVRDGCGTVYVNNGGGSTSSGGVDLPVTNRCDDLVKSYRNVTFEVAEGGTVFLTGDVTVRELELGTSSRVNLNGHTLTIRSWAHKKGRGWPSNWKTALVYPGSDEAGNPGQIVWEPRPLALIVR